MSVKTTLDLSPRQNLNIARQLFIQAASVCPKKAVLTELHQLCVDLLDVYNQEGGIEDVVAELYQLLEESKPWDDL